MHYNEGDQCPAESVDTRLSFACSASEHPDCSSQPIDVHPCPYSIRPASKRCEEPPYNPHTTVHHFRSHVLSSLAVSFSFPSFGPVLQFELVPISSVRRNAVVVRLAGQWSCSSSDQTKTLLCFCPAVGRIVIMLPTDSCHC